MTIYTDRNRELWNHWSHNHFKSDFYDVEGFQAGKSSLNSIEEELLGDISGKSILHLQCHFGLDSLSLARKGANVTAVDLSDVAISYAEKLSAELNIDAKFIQSDIYKLPEKLNQKYDIVYTSYGVLAWLKDINLWGKIVSRYLKPSGKFVLVEFHSIANMLSDDGKSIDYPYFPHEKPLVFKSAGSYASDKDKTELEEYIWTHNLGNIVSAIASNNLTINSLTEYPYSVYNCYSFLEEVEKGKYKVKEANIDYPLMYSIVATKR